MVQINIKKRDYLSPVEIFVNNYVGERVVSNKKAAPGWHCLFVSFIKGGGVRGKKDRFYLFPGKTLCLLSQRFSS